MELKIKIKYSIEESTDDSNQDKRAKISFLLPCQDDSRYPANLASDLICNEYFIDGYLDESWGTTVELDGKYWRHDYVLLYRTNWLELMDAVKEEMKKRISEINEIYQATKFEQATTPASETFTVQLAPGFIPSNKD